MAKATRKGNPPAKRKAKDAREALIEATMALAAEKDWNDITFSEIIARADVPLAAARAEFGHKAEILRALDERIDEALLATLEKDPLEGEPEDRLFEIIMRRLELLAPYKAAIARLLRHPLALARDCPVLLPGAVVSQAWMLTAAGVEKPGAEGMIRTCGIGLVYLKTLHAWVEDDDPGLARTMATLDRGLKRGAKWLQRLEGPLKAAHAGAGLAQAMCNAAFSLLTGRNARQESTEEPGKSA